jgi:hypothetical protein
MSCLVEKGGTGDGRDVSVAAGMTVARSSPGLAHPIERKHVNRTGQTARHFNMDINLMDFTKK